MKKQLIYLVICLFALGNMQVNAQQLAAEKTVDISGKANRGYIGNVERDDAKKEIVGAPGEFKAIFQPSK